MDVYLNPKIDPNYMLPGQQKLVVTPDKNVKRYVAVASGSPPDGMPGRPCST